MWAQIVMEGPESCYHMNQYHDFVVYQNRHRLPNEDVVAVQARTVSYAWNLQLYPIIIKAERMVHCD
jgi:hypothetical protein